MSAQQRKQMDEKRRKDEQAALANVPSFLIKTYDIVNVSGQTIIYYTN